VRISPRKFLHECGLNDKCEQLDQQFLSCNERHFVQELFKRVNTQQCLGSVWSRRQSNNNQSTTGGATGRHQTVDSVATVSATVNQFNAVTFRVISTIVRRHAPPQTLSDRALVIEKWIDIAQVNKKECWFIVLYFSVSKSLN
jgi:Tfp pilus assembly major pilin PilA